PVRDAEEDELRPVRSDLDPALLEAGSHRRADTAATDHVHAFHHLALQFRRGYRARRSLAFAAQTPLERNLDARPVVVDHRVPGRVAALAAAHDHVLAVDALE